MYDKYSKITPIIPSDNELPKHKGIMISATGTSGNTFHCWTAAGITAEVVLRNTGAGTTIHPIEAQAIPSLAAGCCAWYLN